MKLLRVGPPGSERPCAIDARGVARDVSAWVGDWTGEALDPYRLRRVADRLATEGAALPAVDLAPSGPGRRCAPAATCCRSA